MPSPCSRLLCVSLAAATLPLDALAQYAPDYVPEAMLEPPTKPGRFQWHGWEITPRALAGLRYNDQVFMQSDSDVEDLIWTFSPGVTVAAGGPAAEQYRECRLDYQPALNLYTEHGDYTAVDHLASLKLFLPLNRLSFSADATFVSAYTAYLGETEFSRRNDLRSALTAEYRFSDKTFASTALRYNFVDYSQGSRLVGQSDLGNDTWLNYLPTPKLTVGLGFSWGVFDVEDNPGQTYQRVLARGAYKVSDKVNLTAVVGGELRQYDSDAPDSSGLIFSVTGTYRPIEGTWLEIEGHRRDTPSSWGTLENYLNTGGSIGVRQQLAAKWVAFASVGFNSLEFRSLVSGSSTARQDDYFLARVGVEVRFTDQWTAGLAYQRQSDDSNHPGYTFGQNQVGLYLNWKP